MQIRSAASDRKAFASCSFLLVFLSFLALTCSSGANKPPTNGGSSSGGDGSSSGGGTASPVTWTARAEVDADEAGWNLQLRANPDGRFSMVYYKRTPSSNLCTLTPTNSAAINLDIIRYAWFDGTAWQKEDAVPQIENLFVPGLSLTFQGTSPVIAFLGGPASVQCCGGSNLVMTKRTGSNQWTQSTIVSGSAEASAGSACPSGQALCDTGDMVGMWPAIGRAPNGNLYAVYRDIHLCYAKEDMDKSDLEIAIQSGSGWQHEWIDLARGAGDYSQLAFDATGNPAVVYFVPRLGTILFAKRPWQPWTQKPCASNNSECPNGQTCDVNVCLCTSDAQCSGGYRCAGNRCSAVVAKDLGALPDNSISFAIGKDGRYLVAYFDGTDKSLKIAHSTDGITWESAIVDSDGVTGYYPSMVLHPTTGQPGIAYYRCSDAGKTECDRNQDGPRFAAFTGTYPTELSLTAKWKKMKIQAIDDKVAFDGAYLSADVQADGTLGVAYTYNWIDNGAAKYIVMFHQGTWK